MKKIIFSALIALLVTLLVGCSSTFEDSQAMEPITNNPDSDASIYGEFYTITSTVYEQKRSDYDKHIDKDTNKWESNWEKSELSATANIKIGIQKDTTVHFVGQVNQTGALGIDETTNLTPIAVLLELSSDEQISSNKYTLNTESKRTYKGISSGTIGSGMLIIEKSYDKTNWNRIDSEEYENGLFTTNFRTHYGVDNDVLVYSPSGNDLNKGIYIRVTYVYEAEHTYMDENIFGKEKEEKESKMFKEVSVFYLFNENIDAITLHNLSVTSGDFPEGVKNGDGGVAEEYKRAETLVDQSVTYTGFKIENPLTNVEIKMARNGSYIDIPATFEFKDAGMYEIMISQKNGTRYKTLNIYVDRRSIEEIKEYYFPNGFITGKRIYWEGDYPMFEGGYTEYATPETSEEFPAMFGQITNTTTGSSIEVLDHRYVQTGSLTEAGEYVANLYFNSTFNTETPSGDQLTITYRFVLIEQGTAPGPQVNKQNLLDYCTTNVSDYSPKYYGVTYSSAGPGNITIAFSNYQDAYDFAYNYEKGCVEKQKDGSYRYFGTLKVGSKEKYNSLWDLTDATNYFAEQAVQEMFFDLSDEFTYLTIEKTTLETFKNLRTLELLKSVVVFSDDEQRIAFAAGNKLPVIAAKKYQYLTPGLDGTVETGFNDFEFIKDKNGYDSARIVVIDSLGKNIEIAYNRGVAEQLSAAGCATGIITIREQTIYGDMTEYEAIYIASGINTTTATVSYYKNAQKHTINISQSTVFNKLEVNAFSFEALEDSLDPYALVKVTFNGKESLYTFEDTKNAVWNSVGDYTVTFINRLGYTYQIELMIKEAYFCVISFSGIGTDELASITVTNGQSNIILPQITRYGYNLIGYEDQEGNQYTMVVDHITFEKNITLSPLWQAKTFSLTIQNQSGKVLQTLDVKFGETYSLPTPTLSKSEEFVGWMLDGKKYESNTISITDEKDIVVVAEITSTKANTSTPSDNENSIDNSASSDNENSIDNSASRENKKLSWWVWLILITLAVIGAFCVIGGIGCVSDYESSGWFFLFLGAALLLLSVFCMIWPGTFWWFIWWYY